jgi:hypothetical protein
MIGGAGSASIGATSRFDGAAAITAGARTISDASASVTIASTINTAGTTAIAAGSFTQTGRPTTILFLRAPFVRARRHELPARRS